MPGTRDRKSPPPPLTEARRRELTEERRSRAHEELLDVRPISREAYPVLDVANPLRGSRYRVHLPSYPSLEGALCECTDFALRGLGTCKHLEAVRFWLSEHAAELPPTPSSRWPGASSLWKEVDARQSRRRGDPLPASLAWRSPGALLFEVRETR